jgi:nucleoside-diphosphate-sugar epimerase
MTLTLADKGAVLLLGGTGYIGRHLVLKLAQQDYQVFVTCNSPSSLAAIGRFWEGVPRRGGISAVECGAGAYPSALLQAVPSKDLKVCINLIGNSTADLAGLKKSNVYTAEAVALLFEQIKAVQPSCITYHFSSIAAVKKSDRSHYAETKTEGEHIIRSKSACNYVVYHSIVDSNVKKIVEDLSKLAPIFRRSAQLMDRVELTTVGIDFLTNAMVNHIAVANGKAQATDFVILEKEITLRNFMDMIVGSAPISQDDPISLDEIATVVSATGLPDSTVKRFENFIKMAGIEDREKRNAENHYFYFGRISTIRDYDLAALFSGNMQALYKSPNRDFIIPAL